jgi:hypothetical protein
MSEEQKQMRALKATLPLPLLLISPFCPADLISPDHTFSSTIATKDHATDNIRFTESSPPSIKPMRGSDKTLKGVTNPHCNCNGVRLLIQLVLRGRSGSVLDGF